MRKGNQKLWRTPSNRETAKMQLKEVPRSLLGGQENGKLGLPKLTSSDGRGRPQGSREEENPVSTLRRMSISHTGRYTSAANSQIDQPRFSLLVHSKSATAFAPNQRAENVPQLAPGCHNKTCHSAEWWSL